MVFAWVFVVVTVTFFLRASPLSAQALDKNARLRKALDGLELWQYAVQLVRAGHSSEPFVGAFRDAASIVDKVGYDPVHGGHEGGHTRARI